MATDPEPRDFDELTQIIEDESNRLGAGAEDRARLALSGTTVATAMTMLEKATQDEVEDMDKPAADLVFMRKALQADMVRDLSAAQVILQQDAEAAIVAGYTTGLMGRAAIRDEQSNEFAALVSIEDQDIETLHNYPVLGHSIAEWSRQHSTQLHWDVQGTLGSPLSGSRASRDVRGKLASATLKFARAAGQLIIDSYLAGTQAAEIEWRQFERELAKRKRERGQ